MRYLQVRNSAGELVGLMSGWFPREWISRGWISFVESVPFSCKVYEAYDFPVYTQHDLRIQWWGKRRPARMARRVWPEPNCDVWPCLLSDLPLDALRKIREFR